MNKFTSLTALALSSALASSLIYSTSANAEDHQYAKLQQQLSTMSKILKDNLPKSRGRYSASISSTYLAGQGVVFTVDSSPLGRWQWSSHMVDIPEIPEIPVPPTVVNGEGMEFYNDEDIQIIVKESIQQAEEVVEIVRAQYHDHHEQSRELREQERDLAHDIRSLERELRDLEFQKRRAEKDELKSLEKEAEKLRSERGSLEKEKLALKEQKATLKKKSVEKEKFQKQEKAKYYAKLELALAESLCHYGNGLRALPKDENVSVIVKNAGQSEQKRSRDKIVVFSKADIRSCNLEKIDEKELLSKANGYEY